MNNAMYMKLLGKGCPKHLLDSYRPIVDEGSFAPLKIDDAVTLSPTKGFKLFLRLLGVGHTVQQLIHLSDTSVSLKTAYNAALTIAASRCQEDRGYNVAWVRLHQGIDPQADLTSRLGQPNLMIVDNIYGDSTSYKVEKLRDMVSHLDRTDFIFLVRPAGNPAALTANFGILATHTPLLLQELGDHLGETV